MAYLLPLLFDDSLGSVPLRGLLLCLDGGVQGVGMVGQAVHDPAGHPPRLHAAGHQGISCLPHAAQNGRRAFKPTHRRLSQDTRRDMFPTCREHAYAHDVHWSSEMS